MFAKTFEAVVGIGGGVLGILVLFLPGANKFLAVALMLAVLALFTPFSDENRQSDFRDIIEIARHVCVAWAVVVILQQYTMVELVGSIPGIAATTAFDMRDEKKDGRLPNVGVVELSRKPYFTEADSFLVEATDATRVFAVSFEPAVRRMAERTAVPIESGLVTTGGMIAVFGLLLRLVGYIIAKLSSITGTGTGGGAERQ